MNSSSRPFVLAFDVLIVFGILQFIEHGVFIMPNFLFAPLALVLGIYTAIKNKVIIGGGVASLLFSLLGFSLLSSFIPIVFNYIPEFLADENFVTTIAVLSGLLWIVANILFTIYIFHFNRELIGYGLLLLFSTFGWIFFDYEMVYALQVLFVGVWIILMFLLKKKIDFSQCDKKIPMMFYTLLFYMSLEFVNSFSLIIFS